MTSTPVYAETVRATGVVPDGDPLAAEIPAGSAVVELPAFRSGVVLLDLPRTPAPLPAPVPLRATAKRLPKPKRPALES